RQDWQRISAKMRRKCMRVLSVPEALVGGDEVTMAVFHELSRAEGPSQQRTQTDRLSHFARMHKAEPYATLEAVAQGEDSVGVAAVLAQEIGSVAAHHGEAGGGAPVLAESLAVLRLGVHALAVLAHDSLERQSAIDIDGVAGVRGCRAPERRAQIHARERSRACCDGRL